MKTRCLIVDDEPLARDALATLIGKIPELEISGQCQDAVDALRILREGNIDLIFLDIQMPELTGLEMLRSLASPPKVIFTTAYREYAVEAFELDVVDYLVKPISLERLIKAVNRYHERMKPDGGGPGRTEKGPEDTVGKDAGSTAGGNTVLIYSDKKTHKLNTTDILYVEGLKDYALVHTKNARLITRQTMKKLDELLAPLGFIRVHRSWIVPYDRIASWTAYSVSVGEKEIPIGKTYRKTVLDYLEKTSR